MRKIAAVFIISVFSFISWCQAVETSKPSEVLACYANKVSYFKRIESLNLSAFEGRLTIAPGCAEVSNSPRMNTPVTFVELGLSMASDVAYGLAGHAAGAFSNPDATPFQKSYVHRLAEIRIIANPIARIREVYKLSAKTQGRYNYDESIFAFLNGLLKNLFLSFTPQSLLKRAELSGSVGVCREFAALLQWSLQQVARAEGSDTPALGPNDFSSNFINSIVPTEEPYTYGSHAWVRVHLPVYEGGRLREFEDLDLDTTWNQRNFAPLFPRQSGIPKEDLDVIQRQCFEVTTCLQTLVNREQDLGARN